MNGINKIRHITCGHKTFGVKWLFEHTATHQLSATVDTKAARSPRRRFYRDLAKTHDYPIQLGHKMKANCQIEIL